MSLYDVIDMRAVPAAACLALCCSVCAPVGLSAQQPTGPDSDAAYVEIRDYEGEK
jgi:hypothetical protein